MRGLARTVGVAIVALTAGLVALEADELGQSFQTLQSGFTQSLFGVTKTFKTRSSVLGGVAVLPSGDVLVEECLAGASPQLHKFSATATNSTHSTDVHVETIIPLALPSGSWCGMVYHPDGTLYLNGSDAGGLANITTTGAVIRRIGTPGNGVGIAVDPLTNHIVYTGNTCVATSSAGCKLIDVDPTPGAPNPTATRVSFSVLDAQFVNGINFDPTGSFLFLDNRTPLNRLTVVTRDGVIAQHVAMPTATQPVGIAFSAGPPKFVITNNTDATISRFDFPNDDYTLAPVRTTFASGGYRGDQLQVGGDGCAYVTQAGSTYDNGEQGKGENSVVRICGGFAPPPGVTPRPPTGFLAGTVTDAVTSQPIGGATVSLTDNGSVTTDAAGHYTIAAFPGNYDTTASAASYSTVTALNLPVYNGLTTTHDYALMPLPGGITGIVTNIAGAPVANAKVLLSNGKSDATDSAGRYLITSIIPGTYSATVTQTAYDTLNVASVAVPINATATYNFTLTQTPGTLQGVVTDANTKLPLAGATVALSTGSSTQTDATGAYAFTGVVPGAFGVTASATGYTSQSANITVANAATVTQNFALSPQPGALTGVVTTAANVPLANANVLLSNGRNETTDGSGRYSIGSLSAGTYSATVTLANYDTLTVASIVIPPATTVTQNFTLTPLPGALQGVVMNDAGQPIAGASVTLQPSGTVVVTPSTGAFSFTSLAAGTYSLSVTATNYLPGSATGIAVTSGNTTTRNITLTLVPGTLKGTATGTGGAPIVGATVTLSSGISATTIDGGVYAFTAVAPGTYTATASANTFASASVTGVVIAPGGTTVQDFTLTPLPGTIQGVITSSTGMTLAGAAVKLSTGATAMSGADGIYSFSPVVPGTYGISVSHAGYNGASASGVAVGNGAVVTRNFTLTPIPGILQGVVTNVAGAPIAGAVLKLLVLSRTSITDAAGHYSFSLLDGGFYDVSVAANNYNPASATGIEVDLATATTRNFVLTQTPGTLKGTVKSSAGGAVAGATVLLSNGASGTTDGSGRYAIASLMPASYTATVTASGFNPGAASGIVILNADTTTQDFTLTPLVPDVTMTASAPAADTAGTSLAYSFTATNTGNAAATAVVVKHVLPLQTSFVSLTAPSGWSCTKPAAGAAGTVSCTKSSMAAGEVATFGVSVIIGCPFNGSALTATAVATTTPADSNPANNTASATTSISNPLATITNASVDTDSLWPPNHKMWDVAVDYTIAGPCGASAKVTLAVSSDEAGKGDFVIVDPHHLQLRAERDGTGNGRVYTITISATIDGKTFATKTLTVSVVHDQGNGKK